MQIKDYQEKVKKTKREFDDKEKEIMTWGLGLTGEAGDVAGCIKKTYTHGNDQTVGIRENIGDVMWYLSTICNYYGWDLEEILDENANKLEKRYPSGGFTEEEASRGNTRVDWNE